MDSNRRGGFTPVELLFVIATEPVDEDEGRALPRLLVEKIDAVHAGFGHGGSLLQTPEPLNRG